MTDIVDRLNHSLSAGYSELRKEATQEILQLRKERDALRAALLDAKETVRELFHGAGVANMTITTLRAKVESMEKQEPVAWLHESRRDSDVVTSAVKHVWGKAVVGALAAYSIPLYLAPGAQPAPSMPECPYPCGWKNLLTYAIKDGAYLARSINEDEPVTENARAVTMRMVMRLRDVLMAINNAAPEGWLRAIDEALVVAHIGVANASDTYEQAKAKLDNLIGFHVDVATDPAVNGGYKLMPIEPTHETLMDIVGAVAAPLSFREVRTIYDTVLAAPEAKP